jgi:hypothetical protein
MFASSRHITLPARFGTTDRASSVPPQNRSLTRHPSPTRSLPSIHSRPPLHPHNLDLPTTHSQLPIDRSSPPKQLAHQLAAETLLTMAPTTNSASPEAVQRTISSGSVPGPAVPRATPPAAPSRTGSDQTEAALAEQRGLKRKNENEPSPRPPPPAPASTGPAANPANDRAQTTPAAVDRSKDVQPGSTGNQYTSSPLNRPAMQTQTPTTRPPPAQMNAQNAAAHRYSMYGSNNRDSGLGVGAASPWNLLGQRYSALGGIRRDPNTSSPSTSTTNTPANKPMSTLDAQRAALDARKASPDPHSRLYGLGANASSSTPAQQPTNTAANYGHYALGRRELTEHREQLREGRRWLEAMMAKTDKMLNLVENKISLAPGMGLGGPSDVKPTTTSGHDEMDFEERERARVREMTRLQEEREKDRLEKEKREKEKEKDHKEKDAEREKLLRDREAAVGLGRGGFGALGMGGLGGLGMGGLGGMGGMAFLDRSRLLGLSNANALARDREKEKEREREREKEKERTEHERNRDLLLASRRVSAVSPNGRERSIPTAPPPVGGAAGVKTGGTWDGEPVMSGVALPKREQGGGSGGVGNAQANSAVNGAGMGLRGALGRGLWSLT